MKILKYAIALLALAPVATACQDKDIDIAAAALAPVDESTLKGSLEGNDYVWTWTAPDGLDMQVTTYSGNTPAGTETVKGNSFTHRNIDTNIEYTYVFKLTDGTNLSQGVVRTYKRPGASSVTGLAMSQEERQGGYDIKVTWDKNDSAESLILSATNGTRQIDESLTPASVSYLIPDVSFGEEWTVTVTAVNSEGKSLPLSSSLRIGKTAIGFLGLYATPEQLVADGDDDEASAWLWLKANYPSATYIYFGDIRDKSQLDPYRVLFFIRDVEADGVGEECVFDMPQCVTDATPAVREWYREGGNMLLWSHGVVYSAVLGRISMDEVRSNDRAIGWGFGGWNGDVWKMAVQLNPDHRFQRDHSGHPIFKGLEVETTADTKLIAMKGAGWTEDHNCCFFNLPSLWTGKGNADEACYNELVDVYGIIPLATWDSQIWWVSQFNIWEAQQGNTDFKGTLICVGNGGCEFSMRNADGTPDKSAYPKNNLYQGNVLTMAQNALEYLKTR